MVCTLDYKLPDQIPPHAISVCRSICCVRQVAFTSNVLLTRVLHIAGEIIDVDQASASGTSDESQQYSRKCPWKGSSADTLFDLNLPADTHQARS